MSDSPDLASSNRHLSFEFFPPKKHSGVPGMLELVTKLAEFNPSFMTVTYGAGGTTKGTTFDITEHIQKELKVPAFSHLTCISHHRSEIEAIARELVERDILNVLALRGDPPKSGEDLRGVPGNFQNARDLTEYLVSVADFNIYVGGYPEIHPEAISEQDDLAYLKSKIDAGAKAIITQLFFDPEIYFSFIKKADFGVPVIPGVMPISNVSQVKKFTEMCGASIPKKLLGQLEKLQDSPEDVVKFGTDYAIEQCRVLLDGGAPGIHLYTLNKSTQAAPIAQAVSELL